MLYSREYYLYTILSVVCFSGNQVQCYYTGLFPLSVTSAAEGAAAFHCNRVYAAGAVRGTPSWRPKKDKVAFQPLTA